MLNNIFTVSIEAFLRFVSILKAKIEDLLY